MRELVVACGIIGISQVAQTPLGLWARKARKHSRALLEWGFGGMLCSGQTRLPLALAACFLSPTFMYVTFTGLNLVYREFYPWSGDLNDKRVLSRAHLQDKYGVVFIYSTLSLLKSAAMAVRVWHRFDSGDENCEEGDYPVQRGYLSLVARNIVILHTGSIFRLFKSLAVAGIFMFHTGRTEKDYSHHISHFVGVGVLGLLHLLSAVEYQQLNQRTELVPSETIVWSNLKHALFFGVPFMVLDTWRERLLYPLCNRYGMVGLGSLTLFVLESLTLAATL